LRTKLFLERPENYNQLVQTARVVRKAFMARAEDYLKTRAVAQVLGLSVSTIKRWVDSGLIHAIRTVGRYRLIPRTEASRIAATLGIDPRRLNHLRGIRGGELTSFDQACLDRLFHLLKDGHAQQAKILIHGIYASGHGAVLLADQVIRPVMGRIGHGWMVGALDIYQEHQSSHVVASAITELIDRVPKESEATGPLALGAVTEGDPYSLSCLLAELVLREQGWRVRNLGVNLPLRSLVNATLEYRPGLVFLSINYLRDRERFLREYASFHETASGVNAAVIIGGQALDDALRSGLLYTAFGDRMVHLAEFASKLVPVPGGGGTAASPTGERARSILGMS
jgi:excisionase family DNA binding protein